MLGFSQRVTLATVSPMALIPACLNTGQGGKCIGIRTSRTDERTAFVKEETP
jgi:hypothetical protein